MEMKYQYPSPSMCLQQADKTVLGLSPDLSREEKVSFLAKLKHPLVYRDAMLMLREIVISDMSQKKKERVEFFAWLEHEIERRLQHHSQFLPGVRENLRKDMDVLIDQVNDVDVNISKLVKVKNDLNQQISQYDIWKDYYNIERDFWRFIKNRDAALWWVLDPVITVHPDQVSFEAFSLDESTYGCLSVDMEEFDIIGTPQLGTTNIDFSAKLAREMERFRTYTNVELSINPEGFTVDTGVMPEYLEKKIDLPETWIKGFNQVSAAASLESIDIEIKPIDLYDICSFLRRHKAHKSPRYMKWILEPNKRVRIVFEPWGKELELAAIYTGKKKREEKIWGRRRWMVMEKIIPLAKSFKIRLFGFGMPQFIIADLGTMKMTIGFTSWSANDWVKGTAFNIMAGFIGKGNDEIYKLLKDKRFLTLEGINQALSDYSEKENKAGIGMMLRKGEAYFDPINDTVRFRQLCNTPLPKELYEVTQMEKDVEKNLEASLDEYKLKLTDELELSASNSYNITNPKYRNYSAYNTPDYDRKYNPSNTEITLDQDGQITKLKCDCREFKKGPRNISAPCSHILAIYMTSSKFIYAPLKPNIDYNIKKLFEELL
jgi:hypothetical protein